MDPNSYRTGKGQWSNGTGNYVSEMGREWKKMEKERGADENIIKNETNSLRLPTKENSGETIKEGYSGISRGR